MMLMTAVGWIDSLVLSPSISLSLYMYICSGCVCSLRRRRCLTTSSSSSSSSATAIVVGHALLGRALCCCWWVPTVCVLRLAHTIVPSVRGCEWRSTYLCRSLLDSHSVPGVVVFLLCEYSLSILLLSVLFPIACVCVCRCIFLGGCSFPVSARFFWGGQVRSLFFFR